LGKWIRERQEKTEMMVRWVLSLNRAITQGRQWRRREWGPSVIKVRERIACEKVLRVLHLI
jgi:hypothetical protein